MKEKIELNSEAIYLRKEFGEDSNSPIDIFSLIHNNEDLTIVFYPMSNRLRGIILSARRLGYDDELYTPTPEDKQYATFGKYIKLAEELKNKDAISQGKYEEILLNGFRSDIIYGSNLNKEEVYD